MTEDANEGAFGGRLRPAIHRASDRCGARAAHYPVAPETQQGFDASDAEVRGIIERDGLGKHLLWKAGGNAYSAPTQLLPDRRRPRDLGVDDRHELRGHPGIFVTDGSAVPPRCASIPR